MDDVTAEHGIQVLIPPDSGKRKASDPDGPAAVTPSCDACSRPTSAKSSTANDKQIDRAGVRSHQTQPQIDRFHRRGRLAVRTEWRLILMSHNLTKLHRHQTRHHESLKGPGGGSQGPARRTPSPAAHPTSPAAGRAPMRLRDSHRAKEVRRRRRARGTSRNGSRAVPRATGAGRRSMRQSWRRRAVFEIAWREASLAARG